MSELLEASVYAYMTPVPNTVGQSHVYGSVMSTVACGGARCLVLVVTCLRAP